MTRQQKYPDTKTFHWHNQNPKGFLTSDCMVRAVSLATGMDYDLTVLAIAAMQVKTHKYGAYDPLLQSIGWNKQPQPRKANGKKYTGAEFCKWLEANGITSNVVAHIGGHHMVAIMHTESGFRVYDTWDSTDGTIGNWWVKE